MKPLHRSPFLTKVASELRRMRQYSSKEEKKERKAARKEKKNGKKGSHIHVPSVEGSLGPPKRDLEQEKQGEGKE